MCVCVVLFMYLSVETVGINVSRTAGLGRHCVALNRENWHTGQNSIQTTRVKEQSRSWNDQEENKYPAHSRIYLFIYNP